jgi:hypothetical protein
MLTMKKGSKQSDEPAAAEKEKEEHAPLSLPKLQ